ncbi:MAG TPA: FAD-dependent oxidoreductase [Solirubrobacteraceae bacterium]|jgi:predicted NAD/FAD-binding protein|nr:FAD-dependent oxidoreductase [Solirubrobacteraceae bacterium]
MSSMRIAIVGAGVSGLVAAHLLQREHEVVVYEANPYAGGHVNTIRVETEHWSHNVDTGFIVMNDRNYPNLTRLLDRLAVARQPTHMSFSVKGEDEDFEYAGTPRGLFCQPSNLLSPRFQRMVLDLLRFNRKLRQLLTHDTHGVAVHADESLQSFLARNHFSRTFVERLIVPQVSAVWSADPLLLDTFPVRFIAEFFANHGMLGFRDRPSWSTIVGGSARYVDALIAPFRERVRLATPVRSITRRDDHVELALGGSHEGAHERFDQVVIATHSDQALTMLSDPSAQEARLLRAIPYQRNEAVLHTDSALLPRRRQARAAWNFHLLRQPKPLSTVTYYMNHLQRLDADRDFCVTLNRSEAIDPAKVIRTISYAHPVYTPAGVAAQSEHKTISGLERRTHYCGAYWGWGFHEDGVCSALRACEPFGVTL